MKILSVLNPSLDDYKLSGAALLGINLGEYFNHNNDDISVDYIASNAIYDLLDNIYTCYHNPKIYKMFSTKRNIIKNTIEYAIKIFRDNKYDIIHIHLHQMSVINAIYDIIPNDIPVVYTQHTSTISGRFSLGYRDKAYKLSCSTDRNIKIICPSYSMYNIWKEYIKTEGDIDNIKNVSVIRNGICSYKEPDNSFNIDKPYYISCGRIDPNKGMLEIAKFCELYNHKILLIGDFKMGTMKLGDSQKKYYNEFIEIVNNSTCIKWIPYVTNQQLLYLISNSKGYLCMSKKESFGLTIAESLSVGTPILYIEEDALKEICNDKSSVMIPSEELYRKQSKSRLAVYEKYFNIFCNKIDSNEITRDIVKQQFHNLELSIRDCANNYSKLYYSMKGE